MVTNPTQYYLSATNDDDEYYLMVVRTQQGNPERHHITLPKAAAERIAIILEATTGLTWELEEKSEE